MVVFDSGLGTIKIEEKALQIKQIRRFIASFLFYPPPQNFFPTFAELAISCPGDLLLPVICCNRLAECSDIGKQMCLDTAPRLSRDGLWY